MERIQRLPAIEGLKSLAGVVHKAGEKIKGAVNAFKTDLPPNDHGTLEQILKPDWLNEFSPPKK